MRRSTGVLCGVLILLAGVIIYTSLFTGQVECKVCVRFDGRLRCATAAAPDIETATRSAQTTACATITAGRAESLACDRLEPVESSCK